MKASALVQIMTVCLSSIDFVNGGPVRVPSAGNSNIPSIDNPYSLPRRHLLSLNDHKRTTSPPPKPADVNLAEKLALLNKQLRNEVTDKRDPGLSPDRDDLKLAIGAYTIEAQIWGNIDPQKIKVQGNSKELLMAALQQFDRQTRSILKSWEGLKDEKGLDPNLKEAMERLVTMIHGLRNFKAKEEEGSSGPSV
ncbi:hypothetical protein H0H93_000782 [Arthromyces matolae]|nr:hypothetical protein H0H93_000782 [Arthromyces matolae]